MDDDNAGRTVITMDELDQTTRVVLCAIIARMKCDEPQPNPLSALEPEEMGDPDHTVAVGVLPHSTASRATDIHSCHVQCQKKLA